MSINNKEDANKYYQVVNNLIDDYIDKWKIRPSSLKRYLKPGSDRFNKFLERNGLKDIKGANKVLIDVLDDRESMEKDGVITFENFKIFESDEFKLGSLKQCLYKGVGKSSNTHEKALADVFDTSLGHIDVIDSDKHQFRVDVWGSEKDVIIYNKEEIELISENMIEFLISEIKTKEVSLSGGILIKLDNIISDEKLKEQLKLDVFSKDSSDLITKCLDEYDFNKEFENFFIWVRK